MKTTPCKQSSPCHQVYLNPMQVFLQRFWCSSRRAWVAPIMYGSMICKQMGSAWMTSVARSRRTIFLILLLVSIIWRAKRSVLAQKRASLYRSRRLWTMDMICPLTSTKRWSMLLKNIRQLVRFWQA